MSETQTDESASRPPTAAAPANGAGLDDAPAWRQFGSGWRQLYGGYRNFGVSIDYCDFRHVGPTEWSRCFRPDSLELCLNLAGRGCLRYGEATREFEPQTGGFYLPGKGELEACRLAGMPHRFLTISFSVRFLRRHLASCDGALHPLVEGFVQGTARHAALGEVHRLMIEQERLANQLCHPPGFQAAHPLWYQSKLLQLMVEFFFARQDKDELFCDRQKRVARERVEKVIGLLRANLAQRPNLEELGRQVGCSPFHLSRTFSADMQMSIPQFLRKLRMERAAELLRSGKYNVTEAAMEVGYSSLSHFSLAFCQTMGCCPGLYPLQTPSQKAMADLRPDPSAARQDH